MKTWKLEEGAFDQQCIKCNLPTNEFIKFSYGLIFVHNYCMLNPADIKYIVLVDFMSQQIRTDAVKETE